MAYSLHLTRRTITAAGFMAALAVTQVSATQGAVASNETIAAPVSLGTLAQGVATSNTEAANTATGSRDAPAKSEPVSASSAPSVPTPAGTAGASASTAKASAAPAKRTSVATAPRNVRRVDSGDARCGSWCRRDFVLMLGIGY